MSSTYSITQNLGRQPALALDQHQPKHSMSNVKSFGDLGGGKSDSDSEDMNEYYAGGEKSGQVIRGAPDEKKRSDKDKVGSLFDQARKAGAEAGTSDDMVNPNAPFRGTGRTVAGGQSQQDQSGPRTHVITFYRNDVFTVDDGPARRVDDPANLSFIDSIAKGECPRELDPGNSSTPITVNLLRKDEDYKEPEKPKYTAFQGSGRTLGDTGASSSGAATAPLPPPPAAQEGEWAGVNESLPTTSLQLRMSDGTRMVARFNHTHTVADVRRFIRAARPDMTFPYQLMTAFPSQQITDDTATLEAAGLLNAVIIQKK